MSEPRESALLGFERLLAAGKDGPLLRYALGNEYLKAGAVARAVEQLDRAIALDPQYTAAWKLYGQALAAAGRAGEALIAYRRGITVAHAKGDHQAEREMEVFARRIEKELGGV